MPKPPRLSPSALLRAPLHRLCTQICADGERCAAWARRGYDTCYHHDPAERCIAHITGGTTDKHRAGQRCLNRRIPGTSVCEYHGGASSHTARAAHLRTEEQKARRIMETYGQRVETSPLQALFDEVCWTAGHVQWLRERVQELHAQGDQAWDEVEHSGGPGSRGPLVWGITRIKEGGEDEGTTFEATPSVWLTIYWKERDHLVKVCAAAVKAGLDERMVKLAENQGRMVADVLRAILSDLELTPAQHARALEVAPRHLRALSA